MRNPTEQDTTPYAWVPVSEAARALGMGWSSVMHRVYKGDLEARRETGGEWEISTASITAYVDRERAIREITTKTYQPPKRAD